MAEHAARRPADTALIVNGAAITYQAFHRDLGCFVSALRDLCLESGQTVGIEHPHPYLHWLAVLSVEALGAISFSYRPEDREILREELEISDLILCTARGEPARARRVQVMTREWTDSVRQSTPEHPIRTAPITPDTPLRITRSSGTTGSLKRMYHTGRIREFWIENYLQRSGLAQGSRYLMSFGFTIEAMQYYATACARVGGTCIYEGRTDLATVLASQNISHVALPAYLLKQLLDGLPKDYRKPDDLTIYVISAAVSADTRSRLKMNLADTLIESYGTSECGGISDMDGDGIGRIRPGVTVEILNDDDEPVTGETGRIRVRSPGVVPGYLEAPEATARMFRDGWFYPGDLGVLRDAHALELIGRADDMLNIGGTKFLPGPVEERLRAAVAVGDLCLVALPAEGAPDKLCVVVVPLPGTDPKSLRDSLSPLLPADLEPIDLVFADHIPRTEMGKARRTELVQALQLRDQTAS
ncbi:MAG: class I adenylate-forming enzyme family protein [Rhodospirillaceae bacterium]|nr:class I adenylate-forming enzyme family protein [Rhodospirillaceae bacterium]